ncbi:Electromotor neuron-associated protein 2, partial [Clonorchis sinensis]
SRIPDYLNGCIVVSETWPLRANGVRRLQDFDHRCLRSGWLQRLCNEVMRTSELETRALNPTCAPRLTCTDLGNLPVSQSSCFLRVASQLNNEKVLQPNDYYNYVIRQLTIGCAVGTSVAETIQHHQLRWLGHVLLVPEHRLRRRVSFSVPPLRMVQTAERTTYDLREVCLSTIPPEALRHLQEKLPELPDHSEKFANGDALFLQRNGSDVSVSLLFRPSAIAIATAIKNLLVPPPKPELGASAVVLYAGLVSEGSGHWLLPDFVCAPSFVEDEIEEIISAYPKPVDIENLPPHKRILLHIGVGGIVSGGDWKQLPTRRFDCLSGHPLAISVNATHPPSKQKPSASGDSATAAVDYTDLRNLVDSLISELPESCCPPLATPLNPRGPTDQTLRVSRPCLYVFPEGSGQSAVLTLPGYSMLIDSGCSHRPNFWPVATYLDRLDSVLVTHWGVDNLLGMRAVLPVAFETNPALPDSQQPLLCLLTPPPNPANAFQFPEPHVNRSPFSLSLPRQLAQLMSSMKQNGTRLTVYPVTRGAKLSSTSQPIQLYKKIGQGTLELHALTPTDEDTAELRKLNDDWAKASPALMSTPVNLGKPPAN